MDREKKGIKRRERNFSFSSRRGERHIERGRQTEQNDDPCPTIRTTTYKHQNSSSYHYYCYCMYDLQREEDREQSRHHTPTPSKGKKGSGRPLPPSPSSPPLNLIQRKMENCTYSRASRSSFSLSCSPRFCSVGVIIIINKVLLSISVSVCFYLEVKRKKRKKGGF